MITTLLAQGGLFAFLADPAPGVFRSHKSSENLVCERVPVEVARERRPGVVVDEKPRGDFSERSVLLCTERFLRKGLRAERDDAILFDLDDRSRELAAAAASARPDLAGHTWLVDTYYPSAPVSVKVSFATKNALMGQGLSVSDRLPLLGAGDIDVITRMDPTRAYPTACRRYHDGGSLQAGDALLAVVVTDRKETELHGGICVDGHWTWIR